MRVNQPVSQREFPLPAGTTLVSVTDLKGRITYCNQAFIEVSGFSKDELLGQPHNIVRHPDMPEEAFRDMWDTVQSGRPWMGVVKNRRKNGDHYWVQANATPMKDGDRITGFLSVRGVPERAAVEASEQLYQRMRDEAKAGHLTLRLRHGRVLNTSWSGRLARALRPGTTGQVVLAQLAAAGGTAAALQWPPALAGLSAVTIAGLTAWTIHRLTIRPLGALVDEANRMASGDLSQPILATDDGSIGQLRQALNQTQMNLRTVVHDVREEVVFLGQAVQEIAQGNHDLSSRTESQASSLEETAASMEEIRGTVQRSAESAHRGADFARQTTAITQVSNQAVRALDETMHGISQSSSKIGAIIHMIEGVAFQTNILALNAAVEAARAGEHGRGFAVVASEVRALAQRSAEAAREIRQLITESSSHIQQGAERTEEARERMQNALDSVSAVGATLEEISLAADEQQRGISQINEAVAHMDSITQQNAALVEQLAAAAQSLHGQVLSVHNSMSLFRLRAGETSLGQLDAVQMRRDAREALTAPV